MSAGGILRCNLVRFFGENVKEFEKMRTICENQSPVSLRVLDWLCTNYSKSRCGLFTDSTNIELYHKYKNHLKGFGKRHFDPFCRKDVLGIKLHNVSLRTTLGQMNFFRWAFENNVVEFAVEHKKEIESDMNNRTQKSKGQRSNNMKRTRMQLSELASNHTHKRLKCISVSFS